ncbi:MAG: hypothetical protein V4700_05140 [Pseudomonadota bacterium]
MKNIISFFLITLSIYLPQGIFFVGIAGYFSNFKNPLIPLGNVFLLAMIPFVISAFFLAPKMDKVPTHYQLLTIKWLRTAFLLLLSVGTLHYKNLSNIIYFVIVFYDLGFFIYQSTAARISKALAQKMCLRQTESVSLLGTQLGMALGAIIASFLLNIWSLAELFFFAFFLEALGILAIYGYQEQAAFTPVLDRARVSFAKFIHTIFQSVDRLFIFILFLLLLPLQQLFNLITGPWAAVRFHDLGQMLGWLVCGVALGGCSASVMMIFYTRFRDSTGLKFSPLLLLIAIIGLYYSFTLPILFIFSILFGSSFTFLRVIARAAFLQAIETSVINSTILLATMLSVVLTVTAIALLSYVIHVTIFQFFLIIASIAFIQLFLMLYTEKEYLRLWFKTVMLAWLNK